MLNLFPELLTYQMLSPLILRVVAGLIFITLGYLELTKEQRRWENAFEVLRFKPAKVWSKAFGFLEVIGGCLLVIGLFTQGAAAFFVLISLAEAYVERRAPVVLKRNLSFFVLLFAISFSLLFTGAGFLSFDLPL